MRAIIGDWEELDLAHLDELYSHPYSVSRKVLLDTSKWVNPNYTREKSEYPYSYSEFFHFGSRSTIEQPGVEANYSDRLSDWDWNKNRTLWAKHVGRPPAAATPAQLSAYLSEYWGRDLTVVAMAEGCNPMDGFAYNIYWFVENK